MWLIKGNGSVSGDPAVVQADYLRHELSGLRARAQTDLARNYIEPQQVRNSGLSSRVAYVERLIHALERELATLDRLSEGIYRAI